MYLPMHYECHVLYTRLSAGVRVLASRTTNNKTHLVYGERRAAKWGEGHRSLFEKHLQGLEDESEDHTIMPTDPPTRQR